VKPVSEEITPVVGTRDPDDKEAESEELGIHSPRQGKAPAPAPAKKPAPPPMRK